MEVKGESVLSAVPFIAVAALIAGSGVFLLATPFYYLAWAPAASVIFLIALSSKPQYFYYFLVFLVPFDAYTSLDTQYLLTLPKLVGLGIILSVAIFMVVRKQDLAPFSSSLWPVLFLFLAVNLVSALLSEYPSTALNNTRSFITAYIVIFLTLFFVTSIKDLKRLTMVIAGSLFIGGILAIAGYLLKNPFLVMNVGESYMRATGVSRNPNHFAAMIIFGLPLLAYWVVYAKRPAARILAALVFASQAVVVVLTYSRAGFAVLVFSLLLIAFFWLKYLDVRRFGFILLGFLLLAGTVMAFTPSSYVKRIATLGDRSEISINNRINYLKVGVDTLRRNPLLGSGPGTFRHAFSESVYSRHMVEPGTTRHFRFAHNNFVEVLTGSGMLGFTLFLIIIVIAYRNYFEGMKKFRSAGRHDLAALAAVFAISLTCLMVYFLFISRITHRYFWLSIAVSQVILNISISVASKAAENDPGAADVAGRDFA
ncbi:O-antigen ligase family protein [Candidatus Moduliflexota bacterium]